MASSDPTFETFPDLSALFSTPSFEEWAAAAGASLEGRPLEDDDRHGMFPFKTSRLAGQGRYVRSTYT